MKRKMLALLLTLALLCACLPQSILPVSAESITGKCGAEGDGSNLTWSLDTDTGKLTITGSGAMADYDAYFQPWQSYRSQIQTLLLPDGLTEIGSEAFCGCGALESVTFPASLTRIGSRAFARCSALKELTTGDDVLSLEDEAFRDCTGLKTLTLGSALQSIGDGVFAGCSELSAVTIPAAVTEIGDGVFADCGSLAKFEVAEENTSFTAIDEVLMSKDETVLVQYPGGKAGDYTIPDSVDTIRPLAFRGCAGLTVLTLNDTVTDLETMNFFGCTHLAAFAVNETNPNYSAESGKKDGTKEGLLLSKDGTALLRVPTGSSGDFTVPEGISRIGDLAMADCAALTKVTIPKEVTQIGEFVFLGCSALAEITVDEENPDFSSRDGALLDKEQTLLYCCPGGKTGSYSLPDTVTGLVKEAFDGCLKLTGIEVGEENPAFSGKDGVLFHKDGKVLIRYPGGKEGSYPIPDTVTDLDGHAFTGCGKLTGVTIPASVTKLEDETFRGCTGLEELTLPGETAQIGWAAFADCPALTHVCYGKEKADWEAMDIGKKNGDLWHAAFFHEKVDKPLKEHATFKVVAPTCLKDGYTEWECSCGYHWVKDPTAATGHKWGTPSWSWTNYSSAKATFTCTNDSSHTQTVDAVITSVTTEPTCSTEGKRVYTAKVSFEGTDYTDTRTEILEKKPHDWGEPVWTWTGYATATASFTCKNDSSHKQSLTGTITSVTTKATCDTDGKIVYTAKLTFNGKEYTDTKTAVLTKIGHDWGTATYEWSSDYKTVTGTRVCKNDSSHKQTRTVQTTCKTTATCTTRGTNTYTATFTESGYSTQTKLVEAAALGHNYVNGVCTRCGAKQTNNSDLPHTGLG